MSTIQTPATAMVAPVAVTPVTVAPVTPVAVAPVVMDKDTTGKTDLPTISEFKEIAVNVAESAVFIKITDGEEYAQINSALKEMENVKLVSSAKEGVVIVRASEKNSAALAKYINPALASADKVVITIVYGNFPKMRISAKNAGTSKIKASTRSSFFDRDLNGVIDEGDFNYIYGVEGSEFTKALNTKIVRVIKTLHTGKLYSDSIASEARGFHKSLTKIVPNELGLRTADNYSFFFKWDNIIALLGAVDGPKCIETIKAIFKEVYPSIEIDTTKELVVECLKSEFQKIGKERLVWDEETSMIVSRLEVETKIKEAKKLAKEATRAADKAAKDAKKLEAKKAESEKVEGETVALNIGTPVATPAAPVAPVVAAAPTVNGIAASDLINGINPGSNV